MNSDLSHFSSVFPILLESIFMSSSLAVILIDWNHSFLETSLLRLIQSYLPLWRKRNIRQNVYICLVITALALMYSNSMKNFAINSENCRIAGAAIVVLLSFWLQSKTDVSDKCVGTSKVSVSDKSVGGFSVNHRNQETSATTCCRARVRRFILPVSSSSTNPQSEVNIEEELRGEYVEDFRKQVDEGEITQEELIRAIQYLNTLNGGIEANRSSDRLIDALDHIQQMGQMSRLDDSGLPLDFSYEELHHIVVEEKGYLLEDFERVVEKWLENSSFLPSPEEFADIHHDMKVQLEREVEETKREVEETRQEMEEKDREMEEKDREMEEKDREMEETTEALERTLRVVEETTQEVMESQQKNESLRQRLQQNQQALQQNQQALQQNQQALQQNQQALQQERRQNQQALQQERQQNQHVLEQKDRLLDQERQRVRMLEERSLQLPEGEWQRRLREMEEEIRRLSTLSDRSKCKICHVEEVQVSFTPCNHLISCQGCVDSLPEKKCPMCRQPIQGTVKVFFA